MTERQDHIPTGAAVRRLGRRETSGIDLAGLVVSVIMMLGPLAAAAFTSGTY